MYTFENIKGNSLIIKSLQNAIKNNKVYHSYIFYGEEGIGKTTIAKTFAKTLQCENQKINPCNICISCKTSEDFNNPDIIYIDSKNLNSLGVELIREKINKNIFVKPYKHKYKIIIIKDADKMTLSSQNCILKSIEEPPRYGIFLLLATNINKFLPTILSRCIKYKLDILSIDEIKKYLYINTNLDKELVDIYAAYSQGNIGKILKLLKDENFINMRNYIINLIIDISNQNIEDILNQDKNLDQFKDNIENVFDILILWFRDAIILKDIKYNNFVFQKDKLELLQNYIENITLESLYDKFKTVLKTKQYLMQNSNFKLTIQIMLINLK